MKHFLHYAFLAFLFVAINCKSVFSQNSTGINNQSPNTKAALDIRTSVGFKQGFFMPRLVGADTTAIGATVGKDRGLMFFDTLIGDVRFWDGAKWKGGGSGTTPSIWAKSGNFIYQSTLTDKVGIGTASPTSLLHIYSGTTDAGIAVDAITTKEAAIGFYTAGVINWSAGRNGQGNFVINRAGAGSELVILSANGYIGLGAATPLDKLHLGTGANLRMDALAGSGKGIVTANSLGVLSRISGLSTDVIFGDGTVGALPAGPWTVSGTTITNATGTNQVNINYTGQVGLQLNGSDPYWSSLYVNGVTGASVGYAYNRGGIFKGGIYLNASDDWTLQLWDGSTTKTRIYLQSTTGYMGIGTTSPQSMLHVASGEFRVENNPNDAGSGRMRLIGNTQTWTTSFTLGQHSTGEAFLWNDAANRMSFGTSNTEQMTILANGNVGIGVPSPTLQLEILGSVSISAPTFKSSALNVGGEVLIEQDGTTPVSFLAIRRNNFHRWRIQEGPSSGFQFVQVYSDASVLSNATRLEILDDGNVSVTNKLGIGTSTPAYPLEVTGGVASGSTTMRYFTSATNGTGTATAQNPTVAIKANNSIWSAGGGFYASSDARIKNKLNRSNSAQDLATLLKLQVTDYSFKDSITKGDERVKGFIAQEVENIFPSAVTKQKNIIPNIYSKPSSFSIDKTHHTLSVSLKKKHDLKIGDYVKLITPNNDNIVKEITSVNPLGFTIKDWTEDADNIFVYGTEVPDFRVIDYDRLFTLSISAIQEQQLLVDSLKRTNNQQDLLLKQLKNSVEENNKQMLTQQTLLLELTKELEKIRLYLGTEAKK